MQAGKKYGMRAERRVYPLTWDARGHKDECWRHVKPNDSASIGETPRTEGTSPTVAGGDTEGEPTKGRVSVRTRRGGIKYAVFGVHRTPK